MIHDAPCQGWFDHGFYLLQPTLFFDLAFANCYELVLVAMHDFTSGRIEKIEGREGVHPSKLLPNAMLFVAFQKRFDTPFRVPLQGYYQRINA